MFLLQHQLKPSGPTFNIGWRFVDGSLSLGQTHCEIPSRFSPVASVLCAAGPVTPQVGLLGTPMCFSGTQEQPHRCEHVCK